MKRIFSILFALVLAVSLMLVPTNIAQANDTCDLTVEFPGISGVYAAVHIDVGPGIEWGESYRYAYVSGQTDSAVFVVPHGSYDVVVQNGLEGKVTKVVESVDCTGDTAEVSGLVSTLTVEFSGLSGVYVAAHIDVGSGVDWTKRYACVGGQTNSATLVLLKGIYDIIVQHGAEDKVVKVVGAVDCTGDTAQVSGLVSTLTVNFTSTRYVAVYRDTGPGVNWELGRVTWGNWTNSVTFTLLPSSYDVVIAWPLEVREGILLVDIDIKPGSEPNSINPSSKGRIPVAILGHSAFDVNAVDVESLTFGKTGTEASPVHVSVKDADGDGYMDLVSHYKTQDTDIASGDTEAFLSFEVNGASFKVGEAIQTVGK